MLDENILSRKHTERYILKKSFSGWVKANLRKSVDSQEVGEGGEGDSTMTSDNDVSISKSMTEIEIDGSMSRAVDPHRVPDNLFINGMSDSIDNISNKYSEDESSSNRFDSRKSSLSESIDNRMNLKISTVKVSKTMSRVIED